MISAAAQQGLRRPVCPLRVDRSTRSVLMEAIEAIEARHRREKKELRAAVQRIKKSVPKGDKKAKKKVWWAASLKAARRLTCSPSLPLSLG